MDITRIPSKEVLLFSNEIRPWVEKIEKIDEVARHTFKKDTPQEVLDTFNKIKGELSEFWGVQIM
ncbi:hypothetical protein NHG32_07275 [Aerococcaceae bacterium NML191219]|nr:hypothetical protein [Aerococcaceae bacterium NML191219]